MPHYFDRLGHPVPPNTNPAEFILDLISADFGSGTLDAPEDQVEEIRAAWQHSAERNALSEQLSQDLGGHEKGFSKVDIAELGHPGMFSVIVSLLHRAFIKSYRDIVAYGIRIVMYMGMFLPERASA